MTYLKSILEASAASGRQGFIRNMPGHCAVFMPRSDRLVVSFDNVGSVHSKPPRLPWAHDLIDEMGWSHLGVMTKQNDWFRHPRMFKLFRELRDEGFFAGFKDVVFYGASMGGYAAAAFSVVHPGSRVVLFAPQSTLRTDLAPFETRYPEGRKLGQWSGPWVDAAEATRSARAVKIFYDPYYFLDAEHAARFKGRNITRYPMPFFGHKIPRELRDLGLLSTVASRAIKGGMSKPKFYKMLRKRKTLPRHAARVLRRGHRGGHSDLVTRVLEQGDWRFTDRQMERIREKVIRNA